MLDINLKDNTSAHQDGILTFKDGGLNLLWVAIFSTYSGLPHVEAAFVSISKDQTFEKFNYRTFKKIIEAIKDLVNDVNIDISPV